MGVSDKKMHIAENLEQVKSTFKNPDCLLVAVSKTHPPEAVMAAYEAGHRDFGENKVQELVKKQEVLPGDIRWHMIGHVQSNKVKMIAPFVHLIQGVDSVKVLRLINKEAKKCSRTISCLLQVKIAKEESKFGFEEEEIMEMIADEEIKKLGHVKIIGLMGMATNTDDEQLVRREFAGLKAFMERLRKLDLPSNFDLQELSMGMSADYVIAQEEGSTMVRIGSAIFGERNYG